MTGPRSYEVIHDQGSWGVGRYVETTLPRRYNVIAWCADEHEAQDLVKSMNRP